MLGKGIDERPCRSTWWVVSLEPSIGPEICMCGSSSSYYHALGPKPMDPLDLLINMISVQELQLVSGVYSLLEVVHNADPRGGL